MNTDSTNFNYLKRVRRVLGALLLGICVAPIMPTHAVESALWQENFEAGFPVEWSVTAGTWEVGTPANVGPATAHEGVGCAGTVIAGNYADGVSTRFQRETFTVPPANQNPRLRFWHWFSFSCNDYGEAQIKVGTNGWQALGSRYYSTGSGVWSRPSLDLGAYAGQPVQVAFYFFSQNGNCNGSPIDVSSGWYVDEVAVVTGSPVLPNPDDFEAGLGDWSAESGTWEVGTPPSGPGGAHSGTKCAATVLAGNYADDTSSRLISPSFVVPPANQNPRLRFWHWFSFSCNDYGEVQIKGTNNIWEPLGSPYTGTSSGVWSPAATIDLSAYAGQPVQVGLYFFSQNGNCNGSPVDVSSGWYVDDVCLVRGALSLSGIAPITANEESPICFRVSATGTNASSVLHFDLGQRPPQDASIDPITGDFCWTPSEAQGPSTYIVPINCVDSGNDNQNACIFVTITVNEVNKAPMLTEPNRTIGEGQAASWNLCGTDMDIPANALTYMKLSGPTNFTVNAAGRVTWLPAQLGTYAVTVKVTDNNPPAVNTKQLSTTNTFTVTVVPTNTLYLYSLRTRHVSSGSFEFTIVDGRVGSNYVLQCASALLDCPPTNHWQDILPVQATTIPFTFGYTVPDFTISTNRFYRLRTQ